MNHSEDSLIQRTVANYLEQTLRDYRSSANVQVSIFLSWRGNAVDLAPETGRTL